MRHYIDITPIQGILEQTECEDVRLTFGDKIFSFDSQTALRLLEIISKAELAREKQNSVMLERKRQAPASKRYRKPVIDGRDKSKWTRPYQEISN